MLSPLESFFYFDRQSAFRVAAPSSVLHNWPMLTLALLKINPVSSERPRSARVSVDQLWSTENGKEHSSGMRTLFITRIMDMTLHLPEFLSVSLLAFSRKKIRIKDKDYPTDWAYY